MEEPKVTIIVPAYNAENSIERTLKSILLGTYKNIEVLVVNDGSTDATENMVRSVIARDQRVRLISQVNSGVGAARSRGIKESSGEYIAFCDSDDWFEQDYLQEHVKHLKNYNAEISMCRTHVSNSKDVANSQDVMIIEKPDLMRAYLSYGGVSVALWDKVFKKSILDVKEIINELRYSEDLYMNYVACKRASRLVRFNTTKYNWFNNSTSLSRGKFNPVKLECDFWAWNMIIADCKINYPELEEVARLSSELWICGTFRLMVSRRYKNRKLEKKIAEYIRQDGLKVFSAEKNKRNKAFLRIAYISFPLARGVWYVMNDLKFIVKKALRK